MGFSLLLLLELFCMLKEYEAIPRASYLWLCQVFSLTLEGSSCLQPRSCRWSVGSMLKWTSVNVPFLAKFFKFETCELLPIISDDYFRDTKLSEDVFTNERNGLLSCNGLDRLYLGPLAKMINCHNQILPWPYCFWEWTKDIQPLLKEGLKAANCCLYFSWSMRNTRMGMASLTLLDNLFYILHYCRPVISLSKWFLGDLSSSFITFVVSFMNIFEDVPAIILRYAPQHG